MRVNQAWIGAVLLCCFTGCGGPEGLPPREVASASEAARSEVKREVPFKLHLQGVQDPANAGPCEPPYVVQVGLASTGQATHLGAFTGKHAQCMDPGTGEYYGSVVFTAANGDELFVSFGPAPAVTPTGEPGVFSFASGIVIEDGSGRFTGARGEGRAQGGVDFTRNGAFWIDVDGSFALPR